MGYLHQDMEAFKESKGTVLLPSAAAIDEEKKVDKDESTKDSNKQADDLNPEDDEEKKEEEKPVQPRRNQTSLKKVVTQWTGKELCKFEQKSNWELRPLRKTQMHYAALDALSEVWVFQKMQEAAEEMGYDIIKYNIERLSVD